MASQGPLYPGTLANNGGSYAWSNPSNAASVNTTYASVFVPSKSNSNELKATNFGFTVPSGAAIVGIVVEAMGVYGSSIKDQEVRLIKGGAILGSNRGQQGNSFSSTPSS